MTATLRLLRSGPQPRRFFAAHAQSSMGTGAAYVVLMLIVFERWASAWAVAGVLLAEVLPRMVLGPVLGALVDRWPLRRSLVVSDLVRAGAFVGLALVASIEATLAFAVLAGLGGALYNPGVMAALPAVGGEEHADATTGLWGAIDEAGYTLGPVAAIALVPLVGTEALLAANGVTFAISAALVGTLTLARSGGDHAVTPAPGAVRPGLLRAAIEGVRITAEHRWIRALLLSSATFVACLGVLNVAEVVLARQALHLSGAGFSALVAVMGVTLVAGSLLGGRGGGDAALKRGYLAALIVCAGALLLAGLASSLAVALVAFALLGLTNGLAVSYERLLLQRTIPEALRGRVFGVRSSLISWAFAASFAGGGALIAAVGPRAALVAAGGAGGLAALSAAVALRTAWLEDHITAEHAAPGRLDGAPAGAVA